MYRVIDTIRCNGTISQGLGRELLVILDPEEVSSAPFPVGATVRVHRPDGTSFDKIVSAVEVSHAIVGVFFSDTEQHEIPRLSDIEPLTV